MLIVIYLLLAIFVGWAGRNKHIGFVGFLLLALIVTPVVALFILMMTQDRRSTVYPHEPSARQSPKPRVSAKI